jgi:hypothetical protein
MVEPGDVAVPEPESRSVLQLKAVPFKAIWNVTEIVSFAKFVVLTATSIFEIRRPLPPLASVR